MTRRIPHHLRRKPEPCGTPAAHKRHRRNGEEPCADCRRAYNADQRRRYHIRITKRTMP